MSLKKKVQDNTEELAFLAELAGTEAPTAPKAELGQQEETVGSTRVADRTAALDTTAELAFLDDLAGVTTAKQAASSPDKACSAAPVDATNGPESAELVAAAAEGAQAAAAFALEATLRDGSTADNPAATAPPGPANPGGEVKKEEAEETYERDATELLGAFKADEEPPTKEEAVDAEALLKQFMLDMKDVDRDNEVTRVLGAFKLNPFEKLNLRFTATAAEVKRAYRQISLLIHPDRCKHPQASDAFDVLSAAQEELLNEEARTGLMRVLEYARDAIREERRKATKHDAGVRVAAQVHAEGRSGVEREWEETAEFHHRWKVKARDVLARTEWRRMKLTKRLRIEEARVEDEEKHEQELRKHARKARKEWHDKRNDRVTAWQGFAKTSKGHLATKGLKIKTEDANRSYVQRATTEQFVGNYKKKPPK